MWSKFLNKIGLIKKITRKKLSLFVKEHAVKDKTLDIGCANSPYAQYFPHRIGIDIEKGEGVDIVADAHFLSMFIDEEFDCVLCTEVLEHLHTPKQAISEMYRVLKPGGKLILTTRFIFPLHDTPGDYYRYTKYGLKYLLQDFEIIELEEETNTIETLAILLQRIGFQSETLNFKPLKLIWFISAKFVKLFSFILTKQFGSIKKENLESNIMTSGYYIVARKN